MRCINYLSEYLVPVVLFYIVGFAVLQKRPVFDDFIEGALAGLKTVAGILPTLVGLMAADHFLYRHAPQAYCLYKFRKKKQTNVSADGWLP